MNRAEIKIYNEDCLPAMRAMRDNQFDLAIVDPEYGLGEDGRKQRPHKCKQKNGTVLNVRNNNHKPEGWDDKPPPAEYFTELFRVSKNQIVWGVNYYTSYYNFDSGRVYWDKCNGDNDFSDGELAFCSLHKSTRMIRYMWSGMMQGKSLSEGHIQQGNKKLNERRIHPTQKPILLYKWLLSQYAKDCVNILDTHLRSGSIAIACWDYGINLTAYELNKNYYEQANNRLHEHKRQLQLF